MRKLRAGKRMAIIEKKLRKPYWRETKIQVLISLVLPLAAILALPLVVSDLDGLRFIGYPLAYFLVLHGAVVLLVYATTKFVSKQDAIDHWHGAHEDF